MVYRDSFTSANYFDTKEAFLLHTEWTLKLYLLARLLSIFYYKRCFPSARNGRWNFICLTTSLVSSVESRRANLPQKIFVDLEGCACFSSGSFRRDLLDSSCRYSARHFFFWRAASLDGGIIRSDSSCLLLGSGLSYTSANQDEATPLKIGRLPLLE